MMRLIYLALISTLLTGCGGEEFQDLRDFVKNAGADMRGKIPPPPEVKPYEPFAYNNEANLPDPFKLREQKIDPHLQILPPGGSFQCRIEIRLD